MMYLTPRQAGDYLKVSRIAIYQAIRRGTLQHTRIEGLIYTTANWLDYYREHYWQTDRLKKNGRKLYDAKEGTYTVKQVAEILGVPFQKIYHLIKLGVMQRRKYGEYIIINEKEIAKAKIYLEKERELRKIA